MKKVLVSVGLSAVIAVTIPVTALAHVRVTPEKANVAEYTSFSVSVPNDRDVDVASVKLVVPAGVESAMPNVTAGWEISTEKSGDAVSSITWTGTIPSGQRADLGFVAQVPAKAGDIVWKAYQTYGDGVEVSWDQKPTEDHGDSGAETEGPYSVTKVVDDLSDATELNAQEDTSSNALPIVLSVFAVVIAGVALILRRK